MVGFQNDLPLAGVRVLDLGMNIAGPQAASLLADLGADVIKVESPGGDTSRGLEPITVEGVSAMTAALNRNKRYLGLDLRNPASAPVRDALLRWADVAIQNLRPGAAARLGIGAQHGHDLNPRLVHVSIEAFYPVDAGRPGYDLLVQAESGLMSLTGEPDRAPSRLPGSLLDHVSGLWAAFGIVAALNGSRDRTELVISMSDVAQSLLSDRVTSYLLSGQVPQRMGSAIGVTTPLQAYPTADAEIVIGAASDALFRRLCGVLDPDLLDDTRFLGQADRLRHRDELNIALEKALRTDTTESWLDRLEDAGVPAARVRDLPDAVARHREFSRTGLAPVEGLTGVELVANPLGSRRPLHRPGAVGADSRTVVVDVLGLSSDDYDHLCAEQVLVQLDHEDAR